MISGDVFVGYWCCFLVGDGREIRGLLFCFPKAIRREEVGVWMRCRPRKGGEMGLWLVAVLEGEVSRGGRWLFLEVERGMFYGGGSCM